MERMVVGVDGSASSLAALAWAADIAQRSGIELVAVRAFEPDQAELPPDRYEELKTGQHQELIEWCASVPTGEVVTRHELVDGDSPPEALLRSAAEQGAGLLVVGGRGAGGFAHLHLGSVSHHLAHHTDLPLAIVPEGAATHVGHLVVGVDGSKESAVAVQVCADLAGGLEVPATAVYAFEPFFEWVPYSDEESWHQRAEAEVRDWAAPVVDAGARLEVVVDRDIHPVAAIQRVLEEQPDAVAVVGTRGVGGFSGLRLGRTPLQLVHHTGHPVILVPSA